ncbi:hypothetical protein JB92DRAFT_2838957 [Gautieria morchelliformis]|nr:hypothetical protein JB92DRAFT_2838957 [Gautieria morchelliformis]
MGRAERWGAVSEARNEFTRQRPEMSANIEGHPSTGLQNSTPDASHIIYLTLRPPASHSSNATRVGYITCLHHASTGGDGIQAMGEGGWSTGLAATEQRQVAVPPPAFHHHERGASIRCIMGTGDARRMPAPSAPNTEPPLRGRRRGFGGSWEGRGQAVNGRSQSAHKAFGWHAAPRTTMAPVPLHAYLPEPAPMQAPHTVWCHSICGATTCGSDRNDAGGRGSSTREARIVLRTGSEYAVECVAQHATSAAANESTVPNTGHPFPQRPTAAESSIQHPRSTTMTTVRRRRRCVMGGGAAHRVAESEGGVAEGGIQPQTVAHQMLQELCPGLAFPDQPSGQATGVQGSSTAHHIEESEEGVAVNGTQPHTVAQQIPVSLEGQANPLKLPFTGGVVSSHRSHRAEAEDSGERHSCKQSRTRRCMTRPPPA